MCKNCECTKSENTKCCPNDCECLEDSPKYLFAKEMYQHYKELYEVAVQELKFKWLQVDHLLSILEEVVVHLQQNRKPMVIAKVIDNGIERFNIDRIIQNSEVFENPEDYAFTNDEDNEEYDEEE